MHRRNTSNMATVEVGWTADMTLLKTLPPSNGEVQLKPVSGSNINCFIWEPLNAKFALKFALCVNCGLESK